MWGGKSAVENGGWLGTGVLRSRRNSLVRRVGAKSDGKVPSQEIVGLSLPWLHATASIPGGRSGPAKPENSKRKDTVPCLQKESQT